MTAYKSVAQILQEQKDRSDALAKADADPSTLTEADLALLPDAKATELIDQGLPHLGIGARSKPRRRR